MLEKWKGFAREFEVWFEGLRATFLPSTRNKTSRNKIFNAKELAKPILESFKKSGIPMKWYVMSEHLPLIRDFSLAGRIVYSSNLSEELTFKTT